MKKTLIALALTALPVAAMADVVLYGNIKGGVATTFQDSDNGYVFGTDDRGRLVPIQNGGDGSITQMEDYNSYIGFKGEEDLNNGLKAIWQVEQRVSLAGKEHSGGWNTRDTFVGLEGGFGKIRAGYVSDQFNADMETMDFWEYNTGAGAPVRGLATMTRHDGRQQGVRYDSPDFGGFNFNITHQLADRATNTTVYEGADNQQATIVGLNYENGGFFGKLGYGYYKDASASVNLSKGTLDEENGHLARVEAGYDANNLFVGLAYQYTKNMPAYSAWNGGEGAISAVGFGGVLPELAAETHEAAISLAYTMGALTPKLTYAHGWDQKVKGIGKVSDSGYDQVIIGADYALSKRTTALVSAGWMRAANGINENVDGSSLNSVKSTLLNDEDIYSIGVGLRHKF